VFISDAFDGGRIEHVGTSFSEEEGTVVVSLNVKKDPFTMLEDMHHSQYFSFKSVFQAGATTESESTVVKYVIENASETSYIEGWKGFTTFVSKDPDDPHSWTRVLNTCYKDGKLTWTITYPPKTSTLYFSYFPPFSYARHLNLVAKCEQQSSSSSSSSDCSVEVLGKTLDGRDIECIKVGTGPRIGWVIHRQHPGENMAEFYAEGLLTRLLGLDTNGAVDGLVHRFLSMYTMYVVPNMNLDGSIRGHLRTNAGGANLNREWASSMTLKDDKHYDAPSLERSPEVYHVLRKMDETGVDAFVDVHGDEALPFNFLAGGEGCPNWGPRLQHLHGAFLAAYCRANPDMQAEISYEPEGPNQARTNVCSNQIGIRFDCLSVTLEMPFKDCLSNPDPTRGWNPARSMMLGGSVIDALAYVHPYLRQEGEFWKTFGTEDAYIRPKETYDEK